jgi:ribose transport system ATP-binding protein
MAEADTVLRIERVSKSYPGTRALDEVTLSLARGEIHALVGNNGSGKSTLIKILAGVESADTGRIEIGGKSHEAAAFTPRDARNARLHFVHQTPALFAWLSVAENLALGRGYELGGLRRIRWQEQHARAAQLITRFHIRARPETPLVALAPADRTLVAIARALQDQDKEQSGVLVLDEPTAALPGPEVDRLLAQLREYANQGQTILYVSHHLEEILRASDRVSALRDGKYVGTLMTRDIDEKQIVSLMLGRTYEASANDRPLATTREVVLAASGLGAGDAKSVSFAIGRGEIVGIAGILGSGANDVLSALFGARERTGGDVELCGRPYRPRDPAEAITRGLAFLPADRATFASLPSMSIRMNLSAPRVHRYFQGFRLRHDLERSDARAAIVRFLVRASSEEQPLGTLSGGNQQKVVLARWLHERPVLFLLDEPTQGVDVHARGEIHELLRQAANQGTAMLMVSSDFGELAALCDRVLVMVKGELVAELSQPEIDTHRLTELAHFGES